MPLSYEMFMKHADKVCKSAAEINVHKKALTGVMHYSDGSAAVTDAHRVYMAKNLHSLDADTIITPSGEQMDAQYPEVRRLIPSGSSGTEFRLNVEDMLHAADLIASVGSLTAKLPLMKLEDGMASFDHYELVINYSFSGFSFGDNPVWINAKYMLDAMNLFKAAGCESVKLHFYGCARPLVMTSEDDRLLIMILPVIKN